MKNWCNFNQPLLKLVNILSYFKASTDLASLFYLLIFYLFVIYVYEWVFVCVKYTTYMPGIHKSQKRASDSLSLELQTVVSHHASARNWSIIVCNSSKYSCPLGHLSGHFIPFLFPLLIQLMTLTINNIANVYMCLTLYST